MIIALALIAMAPADAAAQAPEDPDVMICRSVPTIGSRLARQRRCATRAQWEENARNERRSTEDAQLSQTQPQGMTPGDRGAAAGRYVAPPARGNTPR
jgi:Holliday junction resolvasome RuvABC DNA-binding subunit